MSNALIWKKALHNIIKQLDDGYFLEKEVVIINIW